MGGILYYCVDILVYTGMAIFLFTKPDVVVKRLIKKETKHIVVLVKVAAGICLFNAIIDLTKLINLIMGNAQ